MTGETFWRKANGELISIDDMDINHLRNTLKMVLRNAKGYCKYCKYIVDNKQYPHRNMCPNNIINSDSYAYKSEQVGLNGDAASSFNDAYYSDKNDDALDDTLDELFTLNNN